MRVCQFRHAREIDLLTFDKSIEGTFFVKVVRLRLSRQEIGGCRGPSESGKAILNRILIDFEAI